MRILNFLQFSKFQCRSWVSAWGADKSVGQGISKKVEGNGKLRKTKKKRYQLSLLLFGNIMFTLKILEDYRRSCFNSIFTNHKITYDAVMKKILPPSSLF